MTITCKICLKSFKNLITSTHLKTHNVTTAEYVDMYGRDVLSSSEYREMCSSRYKGADNPNYGNTMSADSKKRISEKKTGTTPWNKGKKYDASPAHLAAISKREEKYRIGELERHKTAHSDATRHKISCGMKKYAKNNPEDLRRRGLIGAATNRNNGYYARLRCNTIARFIRRAGEYGFDTTIAHTTATLTCRECRHTHTRSIKSAMHERMCPACGRGSTSAFEREIADFVRYGLGLECHVSDRTLISPLELDIVVPTHNLAIEANGVYWHSEATGKSKFYHSNKSKLCANAGYRLIHVFEDEWATRKEICKNYIRAALVASAVQPYTSIVTLSYDECAAFLTEHHILGRGPETSICYAAYNCDEIVAIMSVRKQASVYTVERFAAQCANPQSANALFAQFVKDYAPNTVIGYADLRWETGELYRDLGFVHAGNTLPNYWYVTGSQRIHRHKLRLTEAEAQNNIREHTLRKSQGYTRLWDCGCSKWEWHNHDIE